MSLNPKSSVSSVSARPISPDIRVALSCCDACGRESVFVDGKLVHPVDVDAPLPAADMPIEIADDFEEARQIYHQSPRGAAALLRLSVQKLCPILGAKASKIDAQVGELVRDGKISIEIQQALDTVRVIGNEAVHPGELDLKDDTQIAYALFQVVNYIIEKAVTEPRRMKALFDSLPQSKLDGIANRDRPKP